jgi:hypothetical protein
MEDIMRKLIEWLKGLFGIVAMPTPVKPVTVPKVPVQKGAAVKAN